VAKESMTPMEWLRKRLEDDGTDLVREMLGMFAQVLMSADVDARCGAGLGERSPTRTNQRNGYRERAWDTRAGTIALQIPKVRQGTYFPGWLLEPRRRSEHALVQVVAEAYVAGVSTRKVEALVQTMGLEGISKSQVSEMAKTLDATSEDFRNRPLEAGGSPYVWLDALVVKCREGGRTPNVAIVVATGVNASGHREILGIDVMTVEDGAAWLAFLRGLVSRGLAGVQLVISDAHEGLRHAIGAVLPGASWQRCRTHFMRNLLTRVPKSAQPLVASLVRSIFAQPDAASVWRQLHQVVEQLAPRFLQAAELLEESAADLLATRPPKFSCRRDASFGMGIPSFALPTGISLGPSSAREDGSRCRPTSCSPTP
jgi:putative transposase